MKQTSVIFLILFTLFSANQILAQKITQKDIIVLKFLIPNRSEYEKFEIPINEIFSEDNEIGEVSINECLDPKNKECRKTVYSTYEISANSVLINKNKSRVFFNIEVTNVCKNRKVFNVIRNRQTKIKLSCGVNLIAYYGVESKKAD